MKNFINNLFFIIGFIIAICIAVSVIVIGFVTFILLIFCTIVTLFLYNLVTGESNKIDIDINTSNSKEEKPSDNTAGDIDTIVVFTGKEESVKAEIKKFVITNGLVELHDITINEETGEMSITVKALST